MRINHIGPVSTAFIMVFVSSLFTACSSGGNTVVGTQCEDAYAPVAMEVAIQSRKSAIRDASRSMAPGIYTQTSATLYYIDHAQSDKAKNLRVLIQDQRQTDNVNFQQQLGCVRNARVGMKDMKVKVQGVSSVSVDNKLQVASTVVREYGFHVQPDGTMVAEAKDLNSTTPRSLSDVFGSAKKVFLYRVDDFNYEIRATGDVSDDKGNVQGSYYMQIALQRRQ